MRKLLNRTEGLGLFGGELNINIKIRRRFEGYHNKASETWETQYMFNSSEIKSVTDKVIFPHINMTSERFETFEDFIKRVEDKL